MDIKVVDQNITDDYALYLGDSTEVTKGIKDNSIHFSVSSIPFATLYVYSNSERDMGNCRTYEEFFNHFRFLLKEWYRITMQGRLVAIHCFNLPTLKQKDGIIGLRDFRGDIIRAFTAVGFIYHSEVCIWKDPVTAMQRTKALGLLHKQLKKDSCMSRQGIPDYLVVMRKPGDNPERVTHTDESSPVYVWQRYASPIWVTIGQPEKDINGGFLQVTGDVNPSNTLQRESAREERDERHICPLQLQVIDRSIDLWTNPGDIVFDPFGGIGSSGYCAVHKGRKAIMCELKESYYKQMVANMRRASRNKKITKGFQL
jgi:DNA methylase